MINPVATTLLSILSSENKYVIPKYQRSYAWGKTEALEFMEDLEGSMISQNRLFLGTMIFDVSQDPEGPIRIVDGQQRITTLFLLLIACRNLAKNKGLMTMATTIQGKISFLNPTTGSHEGNRFTPADFIKDLFEYISNFDWNGDFPIKISNKGQKRQSNKIKPLYDFFYSRIENYGGEQLECFLTGLHRAYVVKIDIRDESEALSIFERTNARGLSLEVSDLLKNYLFANADQIEDLEEGWSQIVENSDDTLLRMLKYFYVSKKGYITKSNLYRSIKTYASGIGVRKFVEELSDFSIYYSMIRSGDSKELCKFFELKGCASIYQFVDRYEQIYSAIEGIRLFKIAQTFPLIYSAVECFIRTEGNHAHLIQFFSVLEKYHFINNAICERIGNEIEKPYADFSLEFSSSENFEQTFHKFVNMLKAKIAYLDEFKSRFVDLSYSSENLSLISYIFDRINNFNVPTGSRVTIYNPNPKLLRRNHNIEHFYPQKPSGVSILSGEEVNSIGNLLVISFRTNRKLGNLDPARKIELLNGNLATEIQNLSYVRSFIEKYGSSELGFWNAEKISNRADDMALDAYNRIWKL